MKQHDGAGRSATEQDGTGRSWTEQDAAPGAGRVLELHGLRSYNGVWPCNVEDPRRWALDDPRTPRSSQDMHD